MNQEHDADIRLPARSADGHKGTFGTVGVLGGQARPPRVMVGGPAFSAYAALRTGAGLAVLAMPEPLLVAGLTITPSATGLSLPTDQGGNLLPSKIAAMFDEYLPSFGCLAVGPALGVGDAVQQVLIPLIAQDLVPLVIDADAINALAAAVDFHGDLRAPAIWTPHPGEFSRLTRALGLDIELADDHESRRAAAEALAQRLGSVVVLKGPRTVVTDGLRTMVNDTGNPALATAGSGDVLTGVIASLVAQFARPHLGTGARQITPQQQGGLGLWECACLGVRMHGEAADRWSDRHGQAGLLAVELADELPGVMRDHRASGDNGAG